ncbi:MAG: ABC transporter ATP-binding protein [Candidatus Paceibacterota bacterium]|jgi:ATP-binding cassette subfamily B protein
MKDNTKKTLKIFWQHAIKYKWLGSLLVASTVAVTVFEIIVPLFYRRLFNSLASGQPVDQIARECIIVLLWITALYLIQWAVRRVSNFSANYFEARVISDLSSYCFNYLHRHSFSYFNNNFVGSLVKRVKWFTGAFETVTDKLLWDIVPLIITAIAITVILGLANIWLAVGVIVWMIIFILINLLLARYKIRYDIKRNEVESSNTGLLADTITNNANVKLFNGYHREVNAYAKSNEEVRYWRLFTWNLGSFFDAVQGFLAVVLEVGVFYFAIRLWQQGVLTIGDFAMIQAYLIRIFEQIWSFGNVIRRLYESLSDAEEMTIILELPHEIKDTPNAKTLKVKKGEIEFKNVLFKYHKSRKVLDNFNLTVAPAESVALIGPSGAGKTTVVKLLLRMHDVTNGQILIDGQDIAKVTQESLWQNVSLVPQDPILFHRTLMENIRYGQPKATDKEVIEAAKKAHCHEFISHLEFGYETFVGERGIKLSGGERQRVAIARAILRNAPILVLDEATSSLDSESEHLIQEALNELMKNKTVLVIAHRLSTIRHADRILVIDKGQVVEEGSHDDLTSQTGGIYAKLWQFQAGGFVK